VNLTDEPFYPAYGNIKHEDFLKKKLELEIKVNKTENPSRPYPRALY
jgi:hypothetical protein